MVNPTAGRLAGGDVGSGRLAEPAEIVAAAARILAGPGGGEAAGAGNAAGGAADASLRGVSAVVTAGGTREPIDPVRFIGNRSSGKQGYAIAAELARRGAAVALISTSTGSLPDPAGIQVVPVETAAEMEQAVMSRRSEAGVIVMAAAVADFRPKAVADRKLKKAEGTPEMILEPTTDILAALGQTAAPGRCWWGSRPRPGDPGRPRRTCGATPGRSWRPRAPTWWSPTTSPPPASASPTTPTPS